MTIVYPQMLGASVAATRDRLKAFGIKAHERVAILAPNSVEQFIFILSLWQLKAIACPMNGYQPRSVINDQMGHINARRLIDERALRKLVAIKDGTSILSLNDLSSGQPCTILFTSGSSASPKAALHTFANYYYNALASNRILDLKKEDRWLLSLPLYHVGGLSILFRTMLAGATVVIPKNKEEALRSLSRDKITHVSLVPTQLYRLLQQRKTYKSLKCVLVGGAPIPRNLVTDARKRHWPIFTTYGLTEATSQVATSKTSSRVRGATILPCIKVKISSNSEILLKGSALFKGYVHKDCVRLPLTKEGWFNTHDLGEIKDGRLTVFGRQDNQFISGGENIQPEEIERHLLALTGIQQTLIVPKKDAEFGERPIAFIQFTEGKRLTRKRIQTFLGSKIARFKVPHEYYSWPKSKSPGQVKISRQLARTFLQQKTAKLQPIK